MTEAQFFGRQCLLFLPRHRNHRRLGGPDHLEIGDVELDVTCSHGGIAGAFGTPLDRARGQHHRLHTGRRRPSHHLGGGPTRSKESWTKPPRSRRSMNSTPPRSRLRWIQPPSRTCCPICPFVNSPARCAHRRGLPHDLRSYLSCVTAPPRRPAVRQKSSGLRASTNRRRTSSCRTSRAICPNAFTCGPAAVSGPTMRKKSCTGRPSMASNGTGMGLTPQPRRARRGRRTGMGNSNAVADARAQHRLALDHRLQNGIVTPPPRATSLVSSAKTPPLS